MRSTLLLAGLLLLADSGGPQAGAAPAPARLPAPATRKVDFGQDIKPLLEASCIKCHAHGQKKGDFQIDTREAFLKGGETGPAVVPGRSHESYLIELVAGFDPDKVMPQKGPRLTPEQIGLLRAWIDQGLPWEENAAFRRARQAPLAPRRPALPETSRVRRGVNPINLFVEAYFKMNQVKAPALVNDRRYARRVYLDIIGLPASPAELQAFLSNGSQDKRRELVRLLLGRQQEYAEHWLSFWNDALRNDYRGTGYIDGGRKQISSWLYQALATNMPFNRFVAELVNPNPSSEGFAKGIVWRGAVNASQTPQMQAAQHISQVFLGINLKCASCHDSFINDWKLADAYGLASVYADQPLEMVRCENPTGQKANIKFLFPELGGIDPQAPRQERLAQLAQIITDKQNGRLARTIVNRLWAKFLGRGLVEPVDEMDNLPWHQDLLDWLATDLVDNGYDLKHTIELILTSDAYQYPAVRLKEQDLDNYSFKGPSVRRLSAEQLLDTLSSLTGLWHDLPAAEIDYSVTDTGTSQTVPAQGRKWIWAGPNAAEDAPAGKVYFRKRIELPGVPEQAVIVCTADNSFTLYVNGTEVLKGDNFQKPRITSIASYLRPGSNLIAVEAVNGEPGKTNENAGPAGFWLTARVRGSQGRTGVSVLRDRKELAKPKQRHGGGDGNNPPGVMDFATDKSWLTSTNPCPGWQNTTGSDDGWRTAFELGDFAMKPWNLEKQIRAATASALRYGRARAALVNADGLMLALGRPNREQVITTRPSVATTLQALEMTNGSILAGFLKKSAERLLRESGPDSRKLIEGLYTQGLGRKPSGEELNLAQRAMGSPPQLEGVQDFLWALAMLPEFQLIY